MTRKFELNDEEAKIIESHRDEEKKKKLVANPDTEKDKQVALDNLNLQLILGWHFPHLFS